MVIGTPMIRVRTAVGRIISELSNAAGIVVDERQRGGRTVRKFASAHDLRRAFGQRWAPRVMPRELIRRASINTRWRTTLERTPRRPPTRYGRL
jgi:hypothetical protein